MATPMLAASSRCGSRVEFSATTANATSPWCRYFSPWVRESSLHCGGKMEDTRTRFCDAMPASRSASSKEVKRSRCFPTPLVKKTLLGTMFVANSAILRVVGGFFHNLTQRQICLGEFLEKKRGREPSAPARRHHSSAQLPLTVATWIVLPSAAPVTVAFCPASLSTSASCPCRV